MASGRPFELAPESCCHVLIGALSYCGTVRCFKLTYVYIPNPGISYLSKEPISFIGELYLETKIRVLGMLIATGVSLHPGSFRRELGNYVYRNSHLYFCVCTSLSIYILKTRVCIDISNPNLTPPSSFPYLYLLPNSEKLGSHHPQYVYLFIK